MANPHLSCGIIETTFNADGQKTVSLTPITPTPNHFDAEAAIMDLVQFHGRKVEWSDITVDGGGGTGYIDGVTAIPWSVVYGQDPHGRPFVAFRLTFTPEKGDEEHEAESQIEVLHKRYTNPDSNVWVSAGGNRWLADGAVSRADIERLSRVLDRNQRAGQRWRIYPTSGGSVEACHHVRYDRNVELVAYEHGDIQLG